MKSSFDERRKKEKGKSPIAVQAWLLKGCLYTDVSF
jgi:hypothetical protein